MNRNSKLSFAVTLALCAVFLAVMLFPASVVDAQLPTQLVPTCESAGSVENVCSICHIFQLVDNILKFIFALAAVGAIIMLLWGGFLMIMPWPDPNRYTRARKILVNAFIGVLIIFFSWLLVDTIIKILAQQTVGTGKIPTNVSVYGPWNQIPCDVFTVVSPPGAPGGPPGGPPPPPVGIDPIAVVAAQIQAAGITSTSADCKDIFGNPVSAKTTIDELAAGKPVTVCSSGCTGQSVCQQNPSVKVSAPMIGAIASMNQEGYKFTASSLTTGAHSSASCHYGGVCVDIVPQNQTGAGYEAIRQRLGQSTSGVTAFCETKSGKNVSCFSSNTGDPIDHIHALFPR